MRLEKLKFRNLADAKAKFSEVIEETKKGDVIITKNGIPTAVIINYEKYVKIMNFIEEARDLYIMDVGKLSAIKEIEIDFENPEEV